MTGQPARGHRVHGNGRGTGIQLAGGAHRARDAVIGVIPTEVPDGNLRADRERLAHKLPSPLPCANAEYDTGMNWITVPSPEIAKCALATRKFQPGIQMLFATPYASLVGNAAVQCTASPLIDDSGLP
jgi:hypothetical protein